MKTNRMMSPETYLDTAAAASGITIADLVAHIEASGVATARVDPQRGPVMEFTTENSRIIPLVVVVGWKDGAGEWNVKAEAGPGQTVSQDTLTAYEVATLNRVKRNAAAAYEAQAAGIPAQAVEAAA